jgi:hypothetical protein
LALDSVKVLLMAWWIGGDDHALGEARNPR